MGLGSERLSGGLSSLVSSSREGPPGDSDRVLRAHAARLTTPGSLPPKPCLLSLPQVFSVPDARGDAQKAMALWGTGGIGGWRGGLGLAGCQMSPSPPLTEPPILPALLLWHAQEERPCLPAPQLPPRWPDGDPACGEGLGLGRVP